MSERSGEDPVAVGAGTVIPSPGVTNDVVVSAEGRQITGAGDATLLPRDAMIDIAVDGGHATSGMHTGSMLCAHTAGLRCRGPAPGDATVDGQPGVGITQCPCPLGVDLVVGYLPGDVGNYRAEALDIA
jgi:hypothetical protein